jgi:hypothetical protein
MQHYISKEAAQEGILYPLNILLFGFSTPSVLYESVVEEK